MVDRTFLGEAKPMHLAVSGFLLGLFAPLGWAIIQFIFLSDQNPSNWLEILKDLFSSKKGLALYIYMGGGTATVFGSFGFIMGCIFKKLRERAESLTTANRSAVEQKEDYEQRLAFLVNNLKNFHVANTNIQKSMNTREVIRLAADSLCEVLKYDRVIILMLNEERDSIEFLASRGSGDGDNEIDGVFIPNDGRAGVIYKTIAENKIFKVDDFRNAPKDYYAQPPYDKIAQLRSKRFILCPFLINGQSVGLIGVDNKVKKSDLDETDVETVRLFAEQVSSALTKIELFSEVEKLTKALQQTFQSLTGSRDRYVSSLTSVKDSSSSMAQTVEDISESAGSTHTQVSDASSAVTEIATAIRQVTASLVSIRQFTEETISTMNEISSSAQEVNSAADRSYEMAGKVKEEAEKGEDAVETGFREMTEISQAMTMTVDDLTHLEKDVVEIDAIMSVIEEINQRTRLLSLNASIVAAQAGAAGRPFAVVAEEIGMLSEETSRSASEIESLLGRIKGSTAKVASHIGETSSLIEKNVQRGQETNQRLDQILATAINSMAMAQSIRQETQVQMQSTQAVTQSIAGLGDMVTQTTKASQEQDAGLQRISQTIEEVDVMAGKMAEATGSHQQDVFAIDQSVENVSGMVDELFANIEQRALQNQELFKRLMKYRVVSN